jgi:hypothetical protein
MMNLQLGALAPSIGEQLAEQGLSCQRGELRHFQRDDDAITRLAVRQLITQTQVEAARKRLVARIAKATVEVDRE